MKGGQEQPRLLLEGSTGTQDTGGRRGGLAAEKVGRKGGTDGADIHSYVSQYSLTCSQQGGEEARKGARS